jgi:hypothetical protein
MTHRESTNMKHFALIAVTAGFALAGCEATPLEADYGNSVAQMTENQVYDRTTLTRPSAAAVEGADPDLLNAAVTAMRIPPSDRKEVSKPVIVNVGGQ